MIIWALGLKVFHFLTSPPAAQAATSPYLPPSLSSLLAAVVTNRTPVAPNGWPIDNEPPQVLNFSIGGTPTWHNIRLNVRVQATIPLDYGS